MRTTLGTIITLCILTWFSGNAYASEASDSSRPLTFMRPSQETLMKWEEEYERAPRAYIDKDIERRLRAAKQQGLSTSMSLLGCLDYTPSQRYQDACANCWVWAGTGVLEIADSVQYGNLRIPRHSIQFLNSCMTEDEGSPFYACNKGDISKFAAWYGTQRRSIPWSNKNAQWQDGNGGCNGGPCVSCDSIVKTPDYPFGFIQAEKITTTDVGTETAIANIKNILNQNKAVYFHFCLFPPDVPTFVDFWNYQAESTLWASDNYCGGGSIYQAPWCHDVLLVGYNDDDPIQTNHYWVILNSWGLTPGRPTGLFRMPMYINYDCTVNFRSVRAFQTLSMFPIQLPKTGQTKCYDTSGKEIDCTGTGQDGETRAGVTWPDPRFAPVNGHEADCMTDSLTGLTWARNANLPSGQKKWDDAIDFANSLSLCGHSDWRLPNVNEIESLTNSDVADSKAWLTSQGFTNVQDYYHSSTTIAGSTDRQWVVGPNGDCAGCVDWWYKDMAAYVWPVSGDTAPPAKLWKTGQRASSREGDDGYWEKGIESPSPRFSYYGNQTVTDNLTGLMWTRDANAPGPPDCTPGVDKTWQAALDYAKCLNAHVYLGYSDWRLPNRKELMSLIDNNTSPGPALPSGHPFANVGLYYWSSTTCPSLLDWAWTVNFDGDYRDGYVVGDKKTHGESVWPVRGRVILPPTFLLEVTKSVTGSGTVTSDPYRYENDCGENTCRASFCRGTVVTLTAKANSDSIFTGWSGGGCSGTGTCTVTMTGDITVSASFGPSIYTVNASVSGGHGSVKPGVQKVSYGTSASISITPDKGYHIASIIDNGQSMPTANPYVINNVTADHAVVVVFSGYTLSVQKSGQGTGTVISVPPGINCGGTCKYGYKAGTRVTLTPKPTGNSTFTGWSGTCPGTSTCHVTMNNDTNVTAAFAPPVPLTIQPGGDGTGTVTSSPKGISCGSTCIYGFKANAKVTLTARPAVGSYFTGWTEPCTGIKTTCIVTVAGSITVGASFSIDPRISVTPSSKNFGTVPASQTRSQSFAVKNTGKSILTLSSLTMAGSSFFTLSTGKCTGACLEPNKNCMFKVSFTPTDTTAANATISIPSNDPVTPVFTIFVSGNSAGGGVSEEDF